MYFKAEANSSEGLCVFGLETRVYQLEDSPGLERFVWTARTMLRLTETGDGANSLEQSGRGKED